MDYFEKKQWIRIAVCAVLVIVAVLAMIGLFSGKNEQLIYQPEKTGEESASDAGTKQGEMLQAIVLSMGKEQDNSYVTDYLKQDPYLVNIYEGYGFAKDYGSARGHAYTLEDVQKTQRPHAKANCLTCKTPDIHKMIAEQGVDVYSMPFDEVMAKTTNPISCYTCHGADDGNNGQMVVTHQYVNEALGENVSEIKASSLACGQCHIEYYFTPEDSKAMMPYHSVAEMTPEAILAYYDNFGFSDWEQPGTGTKMLKAQHPELETYLQGVHASILSCADCHMPVKTTESGAQYHDHHLVSPLSSEIILNKCAECHGSGEAISARVREIQAKVTGKETEVGNRLSLLKDTLTAAVEAGTMSEGDLDAVRKLHREAQWFFDYCYVENSEGAHNSRLATNCLNTADEKISEAMSLLAAAGFAAQEEPAKTEEEPSADGSYTEQGFGGDVTVHVELAEDGTVKSLAIDTPNETDGLGKRASEAAFTDQFIGKAGPFTYGENGIDALSGATITSNAALKAINKAVSAGTAAEQAPAAEPAEEKAPEATEAPAPEETKAPAEQAGTKAETEGMAFATYRAVKQNDFSTVTVIASARNGKLTDVKILSEGEEGKDLLTDAIKADWAKAILESGSAAPDAVTGATLKFSAASVQEAMTEILDQMGGKTETAAAEPAEEKTAEQEVPAPEATEAPAAQTEEKSGSNDLAFGTYRAVRQNDFSTVTVIASAQNGKLTDVKILSEGEEGKDLLTDEIKADWAKAILESGSAAPDTVTGATLKFSAASVQEAMTEILDQMGGKTGETAAAEPAEEKTAEQEVPAPEATEPKTEEKGESDGLAFGTYRAIKQNDFSMVTVIVSTKNGDLTDVKILSEGEDGKDLLTDAIKEDWAKAILENGSASPDAITGASLKFSATSVQEAMTDILDQISGKSTETLTEEKTDAVKESAPETTEEPAPVVTEEPAPEAAEEPKTAAEEPAKPVPAFAGYCAEAKNDFSTVTVIALVQNGKLTDVKILSEGEEGKDLLTDAVKADWAKAILENGSASPDVVTGASLKFSAASVQEAMTDILNQINGQSNEAPAEEKTDTVKEPAPEATEEPAPEATEEPAPEVTEEPKAAEEKPAKPAPVFAGYRAETKNDFSTVTVIALAQNGKLTDVKILSEGEEGKDLLTDTIKADWAKAILESGNAAPDAVTGASLQFSAASVQEAMTEILNKMTGK